MNTTQTNPRRSTRTSVVLALAVVLAAGTVWWSTNEGAVAEEPTVAPASLGPTSETSDEADSALPPSLAARATAETWLAVPYATVSDSQRMDLYLPVSDGSGSVPLVVLIHGGAFAMGDTDEVTEYALALVDQGVAVAAVHYRLSQEATFPAGAQDVKAAVRWLRANADTYGFDPERFAAWGFSAGGWMATMLGVTGDEPTIFDDFSLGNAGHSSAVSVVVSWYGLVDFATADAQAAQVTECAGSTLSHSNEVAFESLWLGEPVTTSEYTEAADLTNYIEPNSDLPTWYLVHGDADCVVPYGQTLQLTRALTSAGADVSMRILPGYEHTSEAFDASQTLPSVTFLRSALQPQN